MLQDRQPGKLPLDVGAIEWRATLSWAYLTVFGSALSFTSRTRK